jgi:hypothetical protein
MELPAHIKSVQRFGATFFGAKVEAKQKKKIGPGPQEVMLENIRTSGHTLAVSYENSAKDRWFGSYANIGTFLQHYEKLKKKYFGIHS